MLLHKFICLQHILDLRMKEKVQIIRLFRENKIK